MCSDNIFRFSTEADAPSTLRALWSNLRRSWGEVDVGVDVTLMSLKRPWLFCLPTFSIVQGQRETELEEWKSFSVKDHDIFAAGCSGKPIGRPGKEMTCWRKGWLNTPGMLSKLGSQLSSNWWLFKDTLVKQYLGVAILVKSTNLLGAGCLPLLWGDEFADAKFAELVPWGKDQTFTGLTHGTPHLVIFRREKNGRKFGVHSKVIKSAMILQRLSWDQGS